MRTCGLARGYALNSTNAPSYAEQLDAKSDSTMRTRSWQKPPHDNTFRI
jgi:hypothetical protein